MENILEKIATQVRERLQISKAKVPPAIMIKMVEKSIQRQGNERKDALPGRLRQALQSKDRINIIAELKKASPTQGVLREDFDPQTIARSFATNGAIALSVLTEEDHFQGKPSYIRLAREASGLPVLRKDFIIDEYQIYESRALGADAVLLIAALLSEKMLARFINLAETLALDALVEVHAKDELEAALSSGAKIVGINNRDLTTFSVSLETSLELAPLIPDTALRVSESGIRSPADIQRLRQAGFDGFLIGEQLMRAPDPGRALKALLT